MKLSETEFWIRLSIVVFIVAIGAIDLLLLFRYGPDATISVVLRKLAANFPILPYLIAFGMGAFLYHITYK